MKQSRTNVSKCEIMVSNNWNDSTEVKVVSSAVSVVEDFCYLEELLPSNSNCDKILWDKDL